MNERERDACIALLEQNLSGGMSVYNALIKSFDESKDIIGNVSMNFEDIIEVLKRSRSNFKKLMEQKIKYFQEESMRAIYERRCD